jgi:hypothetical protein
MTSPTGSNRFGFDIGLDSLFGAGYSWLIFWEIVTMIDIRDGGGVGALPVKTGFIV